MKPLPSIFDTCQPRPEILAGELPDALFAADLWDVVRKNAHKDYQDTDRFFTGTHPTANLKLLLKDVAERLDGAEGGTSTFRLETGFGGGKTHSLIATVHVAREGRNLAQKIAEYGITRLPEPGRAKIAAFVGENSDPLSGTEHTEEGQKIRTYTPWGQIALMAGGLAGYEQVKDNDIQGVAPSRDALEQALGDRPVLILIDELVLYMARCFALPESNPRSNIGSQWATFFQTLLSVAARRPGTVVIITLPSEQDANRRVTGEMKEYLPEVLNVVDEVEKTAARQARNLTPTQSTERAAVLARRLFQSVDSSKASDVADTFAQYYQDQKNAGVTVDPRAFEAGYREQLRVGYPFHPELIRLFSERLADIPEFQATRGALRLVARTIRGVWAQKKQLKDALLLQPQHIDLTRSDLRDEILARLGRTAFERGLDVDVTSSSGGTHATEAESGWPWQAASESALLAFLHSLPDASRGVTAPEVALAVGRPGVDLAYVHRGLEDTERKAWYMRREGEHFLFRTRASINKRFQEHLTRLQAEPGVIRQTLDDWTQKLYSGFSNFQIILFPADHTAIADNPDRLRLVVVHYDKECGNVGGGDRLNFAKKLFTTTGVHESPRGYRNNLVFLLAESSRIGGVKDGVRSLIAWERVQKDIETEQGNLAQASGTDYQTLKKQARLGASGVPAEFLALENDLSQVFEKVGQGEINVRTKVLEAFRILAFPKGGRDDDYDLFRSQGAGTLLQCYRVDFGELPEEKAKKWKSVRQPVAEGPILQCLRQNQKLVPESTPENPLVLAPALVKRAPLWKDGETKVSTDDVWDRIRREPEVPMVLKPTDLLPTFREGLLTNPDATWIYYNQGEKKVWNRDNAAGLSPVIAPNQFLYDPKTAVLERIVPVANVTPQEIWDHLWPKEGVTHVSTVASPRFLEAAKECAHFPVLPDRGVLWQALQEGARENRWVLYLRGPSLAIGAQEMNEWPGTPRFEEDVEVWTYQAALDQGIYPRKAKGKKAGEPTTPLVPQTLKELCWPSGADRVATEDLERFARNVWPDATRPLLEDRIRAGLQGGLWCAWKQGADETFYTKEDAPAPAIQVSSTWILVDPESQLAKGLDALRPGKGPQPVEHAGTPREVLTHLWEELAPFKDVRVAELSLTVNQREGFDNTLRATWADRPKTANTHASVTAAGQRDADGRTESVNMAFEGRFEEVSTMLSPVWPFQKGDLDMTIAVRLIFDPPVALADGALDTYRTAIMNANQGTMSARVVPVRKRQGGDG
jgi:hypothetical protein